MLGAFKVNMRFFILISLSLFWLGCPGPSASLLLMKQNEPERSDWHYFASETEGIFRVNQFISADSLNNLPTNTPVKIELRNELTLVPQNINSIRIVYFIVILIFQLLFTYRKLVGF